MKQGDAAILSRRLFVGAFAGAGAVLGGGDDEQSPRARTAEAYRVRVNAARLQRDAFQPDHAANGDEERYVARLGSYSKGLPHNESGEVDGAAYETFLKALARGRLSDLENVPMGGGDPSQQRRLVNPCAGIAFTMLGADSHHLAIPVAPAVASAETGGEMVELYWHALARDIPFTRYDSDPVTQAAAADLSAISDFRGPKENGRVTAGTLFRGLTAGDLAGPYISQFLLKPVQFGAQYVEQRMRTVMPGADFLTQYPDWLAARNGRVPSAGSVFDAARRFIRNGRDLSQWVHVDVLYEAYFNAMLIMLQPPDAGDELTGGGMGVPLNPGNPYLKSNNQDGFGTFGPPAIATSVTEVATSALRAVWYQKWFVHRRLRPEDYGGLAHNYVARGQTGYPVHRDVLNSAALAQVQRRNGTSLLPMVFPEGCPLHPSYGAGHATVAGACVTILKAVFDESFVIPDPVVASEDGLSLMAYRGPDAGSLTVGGELNKLAANIGIGRNFAGVHWRSDYTESLRLGEAVAISVLRDQKLIYGEEFEGFTFTTFDGVPVTV